MNVAGEESYRNRVMPLITALNGKWEFLGVLGDVMETFYAACDVTVLPSVNCTESFGLVQVESMLSGTPVVASNIPGVRMPIKDTGMGKLAAPGNSRELADAIVSVLQNRKDYIRPAEEISNIYSLKKTVGLYDDLINRVTNNMRSN
jgi:glycosyltransferase involved in cell wall biosynthesis